MQEYQLKIKQNMATVYLHNWWAVEIMPCLMNFGSVPQLPRPQPRPSRRPQSAGLTITTYPNQRIIPQDIGGFA